MHYFLYDAPYVILFWNPVCSVAARRQLDRMWKLCISSAWTHSKMASALSSSAAKVGPLNLISCPQVPKSCRTMSSLRISLGFCSCCVRATTMVGGHIVVKLFANLWRSKFFFFFIWIYYSYNVLKSTPQLSPGVDFQNFLRTQTGNTTTVNIIISTVDYLLRLQV